MKSFLNFIQYHNFAVFIAVVLVGFGGSAFAATEVARQLSTTQSEVSNVPTPTIGNTDAPAVDTSALLDADLDTFDMNLRITSAVEKDSTYTIVYRFNTYSVVDGAWQKIEKESTLGVDKAVLLGTDINTYALAQLSEVATEERAFLREVQINERTNTEKGSKVRSLAGLSLDALADLVHVERVLPEIIADEPVAEASTHPIDTASGTPSVLEASTSTSDTNTASTTSTSTPPITPDIAVITHDTTPPVITVNGTNPETITISTSTSYVDAGATAQDDVDGTVEVITTGNVDQATVGSYTITYTATDLSSNGSVATRVVEVQ